MDHGMTVSFDFIALPKGQEPGGAIQASDGSWYFVLPARLDLADLIDLVCRFRRGRAVSQEERLVAARGLRAEGDDQTIDYRMGQEERVAFRGLCI